MTERPKVTVLMSAYNAERHIAEAVDSVLAQTFSDFEFLIFEDDSTDSTLRILRGYSDPRILLVGNSENQGLTRNLERGIRMARGEYVARMDADDICMPHRLARQVEYLSAHPDVAVLGSAVTFFGDGKSSSVGYQPLEHDEIKCALLYGFTMLHPTVMIRKSEFERHRLNYDPAFRVSQDHDLWVRAIRKVRFANLGDPLLEMREHRQKVGRTHYSLQQGLSDVVRQRQLAELGIEASAQEMRVLVGPATCAERWNVEDCKVLEALLLRVFSANAACSIFDQDALVRMGVGHFRGSCRQLLAAGNRSGRYYWRSELRRLDSMSFRERAGFTLRSLLVSSKRHFESR